MKKVIELFLEVKLHQLNPASSFLFNNVDDVHWYLLKSWKSQSREEENDSKPFFVGEMCCFPKAALPLPLSAIRLTFSPPPPPYQTGHCSIQAFENHGCMTPLVRWSDSCSAPEVSHTSPSVTGTHSCCTSAGRWPLALTRSQALWFSRTGVPLF